MKRIARAATLAFALVCGCLATVYAVAQSHSESPGSAPGQIKTFYAPWAEGSRFAQLRQRKVLEELQEFLAPLHLPRDLVVQTAPCGGHQTVPYEAGGPVTICYDLVDRLVGLATEISPQDLKARESLIVGGFIQATLHETAHGIFDVLRIPIWGREEDAADRLAALVMVEFGDDVANTVLISTLRLFQESGKTGKTWTGSDFADTASPDAQRFYNYLCIGAAADPLNYGWWLAKNDTDYDALIPPYRAPFCSAEYQQIRKAFNLRIMPNIDADALIKAKSTRWLDWTQHN